jgi:hypothetical protein
LSIPAGKLLVQADPFKSATTIAMGKVWIVFMSLW